MKLKLNKPTWKVPAGLFQTVYSLPIWQKAAICIVVWSLPVALAWFLFLAPAMEEIRVIEGKVPKLKKELAILEAKAKRIPDIEKELKDLELILKKALKLLPEKEDIPSVLTDVSSLGNQAGLEVKSFNPNKERVNDFYAAIPVSLSIKGPFHNTVSFFNNVGRMARIVHIQEINMGKAFKKTEIWSQKGTGAGGKAAKQAGGDKDDESVESASNWIINTQCKAVTYRFLSPEEQKAMKNKKKGKKR